MYREDGSFFDEKQLRSGGRFIRERVPLTVSDRHEMAKAGYTLPEIQRANRALNIEIDNRIRGGESEREVLREMNEIISPEK